ncbi:hypothetical protein NP233_g8740 [Leucocoprinus birnbaumii]|uniref:Deacetylase sirtuin-type domain-containing protein n=1 Tax=Leucocoprinus birnbaumii TaxID=56174 RepID=A0AAD5YNS9_9AGAR|nr:hypothetical protein NP233_g8740 [Leucocoprinus birnbaumii]
MRITVPGIPQAILSAALTAPRISRAEAIDQIATFIEPGNVAVLTGAGVSVDSGIRAYRGHDGRYMNPNYKCGCETAYPRTPLALTGKGHNFRLRSYLGYPPVRDALPNTTHFAIAALQHTGTISQLITQKVHCSRGHTIDRDTFQDWLSSANPKWRDYADEMERTGTQPRTNPDGDVAVEHLGISYSDFLIPDCPKCLAESHHNTVHKPQVVFFGESIPQAIKDESYRLIDVCDRLLVIGTTLATYSAFRLLRHALDQRKPVMVLNVGPTRADTVPEIQKIDYPSGLVLRDVARLVLGAQAEEEAVHQMLQSGIVRPPQDNDDDRAPRAAG